MLKLGVPGLLVLATLVVWLVYPRPTDRELVYALLQRGEHGIETKNVREIMGCVSPDYQDREHTYSELYRMVLGWPRVAERGEVTVENLQLDLGKETGSGTMDVTFVLIEKSGRRTTFPLHLTMTFEKRRQTWHHVWLVKSVGGYDEGTLTEGVTDAE